jgi:hypothetical protein
MRWKFSISALAVRDVSKVRCIKGWRRGLACRRTFFLQLFQFLVLQGNGRQIMPEEAFEGTHNPVSACHGGLPADIVAEQCHDAARGLVKILHGMEGFVNQTLSEGVWIVEQI